MTHKMILHVTSAAEADALCTSATMRGDTFTVEETRAGVWTFVFSSLQRTVPRSAHPLSHLEN